MYYKKLLSPAFAAIPQMNLKQSGMILSNREALVDALTKTLTLRHTSFFEVAHKVGDSFQLIADCLYYIGVKTINASPKLLQLYHQLPQDNCYQQYNPPISLGSPKKLVSKKIWQVHFVFIVALTQLYKALVDEMIEQLDKEKRETRETRKINLDNGSVFDADMILEILQGYRQRNTHVFVTENFYPDSVHPANANDYLDVCMPQNIHPVRFADKSESLKKLIKSTNTTLHALKAKQSRCVIV